MGIMAARSGTHAMEATVHPYRSDVCIDHAAGKYAGRRFATNAYLRQYRTA
ncbi:hypothetical protein [Aneurinibacillus migulanus]|uniref:hypothetical protein n=1 Tax=Aneurinibacillus migulanus TaxID=47500 RepID=UPI00130DFBA0|nr:hypothetical protein [Aneurinibacillus migulanus]MED0896341.1 hypothetical protein [Aneurinibacillus migulanus]MED1618617.1 hypothetical protein [Aneurinibacillus migulanus]